MEANRMLGQEKISKLLLKFSVPCVTGLLIGAFYNIVDQIFIGNSSLGYLGNAATGISFPIICIANAFAWCVGDGAASYLSICAGRRDSESAHKCVGTGISATLIISIVLTAICMLFCGPLMELFGASSETLGLSMDYFYIIAAFFPVYLIMNVTNSMIRADGSPSFAMAANVTGAVLNIILDPVFIFALDWGIRGAAIATVIGQTASFIICMVYFRKPKSFVLTKESFRIDFSMLRNLITLGGSTFIIQISMVVMTLLSNITLAGYGALSVYGSDIPISVFSIQTKVYTIVNNIAVGIALGGQPILGYNYGAGKMDRVRKTYRLILISSLSVGIIATLIFEFFPETVINIFGAQDDLYMEFAVRSFRISLCLAFVTCFIKISSIFFQAIGKAGHAMVASVIRDMICFVVFTLSLCSFFESSKAGTGIYGILMAAPLSDFVAGSVVTVLTFVFFRKLTSPETDEAVSSDYFETGIAKSRPGIVVTIARQHGSCGKQIGELVAEKLGVPFYCKEIAAIVAHESGMTSEYISEDNEDYSKRVRQMYLSTEVVQQAIIAQEKVIRNIADRGACVIVGRAANHVLRNYDNVYRVFMYAPDNVRIENISRMYGDSSAEAKTNMIRSDEARASYYMNITGKKWLDMNNYDLCFDTSAGNEESADLIVRCVREAEKKINKDKTERM